MTDFLKSFFEKEKIEYYRSAKISADYVVCERRLPPWAVSVTVFLIPYGICREAHNVSQYAVARDYHLFVAQFSERLKKEYAEKGFGGDIAAFADTSPFNERTLAAHLKLGFIGKNGLLINEKYGSFVFVGEIVTSAHTDLSSENMTEKVSCAACGKCITACPTNALVTGERCVSEITQKKNTNNEENAIIASHCISWGCDICQEVCPHNIKALPSPIPFFGEKRLPNVTAKMIDAMSDEEFSARAYAWRGKKTITRNLILQAQKAPAHTIISDFRRKINNGDNI